MNDINFEKDSLTREGREKIIKELSMRGTDSYIRERDIESWNMYNNQGDTDEFNFLTDVGKFSLPAKIRRVPIQRTKANILLSQQSLRHPKYGIKTIDSLGVSKKLTMLYQSMIMMFAQMADQKYRTIQFQIQQIDQQVQQMQQMLSQKPQTSEEAQQQAEIRKALPQIIFNTTLVKDNMNQAMSMSKDEVDKFLEKFKDKYEDLYESYAHKLLVKLREDMDTDAVSLKNFRNKIVTGNEFIYTNFNWKTNELEYKSIPRRRISYPNIEDIDWTYNLPWIVIESFMTKEQIRKEYNLTGEQLKKLESLSFDYDSSDNGQFVTGPGQAVVLDNNAGKKQTFVSTNAGISVKKVWWRTDHKITAIQNPNKYREGGYFTNFLEQGVEPLDTSKHSYNRKTNTYKNKRNGNSISGDKVKTYNSTKGDRVQTRYFDKRYVGVSIANGAIILSSEDRVQPHPQDTLGYTPLPVVGRTYNGIGDSPYSIIWATTELQKQYWIVSYHRELTFALAGASGVVFDMSQKPDGMTKEEWFYHMKLGRYLIQTISKTGARKNTGFNQFSKVDQTLTNSIQYFEYILQGIETQIGTLMGVPRQRQGEVESSDQVGTFQQSNKQAALVTEIMFKEHDEVEVKALEQLLNLAIQYKYKPGDIVDVTDEEAMIIKIPYDFNMRKFRMKVLNSAKQELDLDEMKRFAMQSSAQGNPSFPFEFVFKLFNVDSVQEMENLVDLQVKKQAELMQLQQQSNIEAQSAAEQKKIEIQQQFEASMKGMEMKLKDASLRLEEMLGNRKLDIEQMKAQIDAQNKQQDAELKAGKDSIDAQIDIAKHQETVRSNVADEKLKETELQLEALLKSTGVNQGLGIGGAKKL